MDNYDPFKVQVGGNHYAKYPIQPMEYIEKNKLPFADGSIIKYITRWRDKGGIEDLRKAKHFIEMLIALEERKGTQGSAMLQTTAMEWGKAQTASSQILGAAGGTL